MGFAAGQQLAGAPINVVFIGSCTNSRLTDLQAAAGVLKGRHIAPGVQMLVVPGSQQIKKAAEAEGLDQIFIAAGAEWRESGCSMCLGMNGDTVGKGQYSLSTSNRNFEGRQGVGARTLLASPLTAAASAVRGAHHRSARPAVNAMAKASAHSNRSAPSRRAPWCCRARTSTPTRSSRRASCAPPRAKAWASSCSPTGATWPTARPTRTSCSTVPRPAAARCWWAGATSAAAPRASTRPGRCSTSASAPSSAASSPTSSAPTR